MPANPTRCPSAGGLAAGVASGMGAGALWGLVFLAPVWASDFSPWLLSAGRYLCYGAIAWLWLWCKGGPWRLVFAPDEWRRLHWLGLTGNTLYYVFLSSAVQMAGVATTSLVIGFMPVVVSLIGSQEATAPGWRRMKLSLGLCVAGALCIGWQALLPGHHAGDAGRRLVGLGCALGALASWTCFAVGNARSLTRSGAMTSQDWNLLVGVATGLQGVLLLPLAWLLASGQHGGTDWLRLAGVSLGVAWFASILGNGLWNRMSRLLPLSLVGQMILFETAFAMLYGLLWARRWPTPWETAALLLVIASVLAGVSAHQRHQRLGGAIAAADES